MWRRQRGQLRDFPDKGIERSTQFGQIPAEEIILALAARRCGLELTMISRNGREMEWVALMERALTC